jgi:predicted helicase
VYNFSSDKLRKNIKKTIKHYNSEREQVRKGQQQAPNIDSKLGSWSRDWQNQLKKNKIIVENKDEYKITSYRPFVKTNSYFDDDLNQERYQLPKLFSNESSVNPIIVTTGVGASKPFSCLMVRDIPNYDFIEKANCFPLYFYEESHGQSKGLFDSAGAESSRRDGVSNIILEVSKKKYGRNVIKEDIFYYVYALLHSLEYRDVFANDLKKMLPRLPLVEDVCDFWAFSKAGRKLADLHINYESVEPHPTTRVVLPEIQYQMDAYEFYSVEKMRFPKKDQKDIILYNSRIRIENIPAKAYEYVVNGKSAIEWIMERYQVKTDPASGIKNDPNDWSREVENPSYILDLLLSIINVSVQTVDIVAGLPKVKFE